eukprot:Skav218415  [mRNA]  locus=scaffold4660:8100:9778:- [translate_table: standard]
MQDRISRTKAGQLVECGDDEEMLGWWCRSKPIKVSTLPLAIIGSGASHLSAKVESLFHSVKLDVSEDPAALQAYSESCVSFCSDFGTEFQIPEVPSSEISSLMTQAVKHSDGLLQVQNPENQEEPLEDRKFTWSLNGSVVIPGQKHIMSNISGDLTQKMLHFKEFQNKLSALNTLMHQKYYRDRLKHLMSGTPYVRLFEYHSAGCLILWRWGSLVTVCESFHKLEGALRTHWDLRKFLAGNGDNDGEASGNRELFAKADSAIRSNFFWAYLKFVLLIHGVINDLGLWSEGCPCHGHKDSSCPLKGRRAPELAAGFFWTFLHQTFCTASSVFSAIAAGLGERSQEWEWLSTDYNMACDIAIAELQVKTVHWGQLPWLLCGLGMPDCEVARSCARKAIAAYENDSIDALHAMARRHPMVKRFLKPGGELRYLVDQFLLGANMAKDDDMRPLREWVGALRLIRIVERETEAD